MAQTRRELAHEMSAQAKGHDLMGAFVSWELDGVRASRDDLQKMIEAAGINNITLPMNRMATAISRTLGQMKDDGIVVKGSDDDKHTVYFLARKLVDHENDEVAFDPNTRVTYWKSPAAGEPSLTFRGANAQELSDLITFYRSAYTAEDIVERILNPIVTSADSIPLKKRGGVHFVPQHKAAAWEQLQDFLARLAEISGKDVYLNVFPLPRTAQAVEGVSKAAHKGLEAEVAALMSDLAGMSDPKRAEKVRPTTATLYIQEVQALEAKAEFYRNAFRMQASDIDAELVKLRKGFEKFLTNGASFAEKQAGQAGQDGARPEISGFTARALADGETETAETAETVATETVAGSPASGTTASPFTMDGDDGEDA